MKQEAAMEDLTVSFLELVRFASTDLPPDVEGALKSALDEEKAGSAAAGALETILRNVAMAREKSTPICQDTGTPLFFIKHPVGMSTKVIAGQIRDAVAQATKSTYLRPNAVDSVTGKNTGNNLGGAFLPTMHFEEHDSKDLVVDLMLKGGGSENVGTQYSMPYAALKAGRDLEGVYRVALDAVFKAQGKGCAPGVLGIAIGADRSSGYLGSKEVLLRKLDDTNPVPELAELEERIFKDANRLSIGPMGFGGKTTVLGVKIASLHRHPASFFVTVSYMCWACRRRRMVVSDNGPVFS